MKRKGRRAKRRRGGRVEPGETIEMWCACGYPRPYRVPADVKDVRCHFCLMGVKWQDSTANPEVAFKEEHVVKLSKEWFCSVKDAKVRRVRAHCVSCGYASEECELHVAEYNKRH